MRIHQAIPYVMNMYVMRMQELVYREEEEEGANMEYCDSCHTTEVNHNTDLQDPMLENIVEDKNDDYDS